MKLKKWVKETLIAIAVIPVLALAVISLNELDKDFVENCMANGYSRNYCERSK